MNFIHPCAIISRYNNNNNNNSNNNNFDKNVGTHIESSWFIFCCVHTGKWCDVEAFV